MAQNGEEGIRVYGTLVMESVNGGRWWGSGGLGCVQWREGGRWGKQEVDYISKAL